MSSLVPHFPLIVTILLGTAGAGGAFGLIVKLFDRWATHVATKRKQTDEVAMALVEQLRDQMAKDREIQNAEMRAMRAEMAAERQSCESQLTTIRHRLANELTHSDALELAIRANPADAIATIERAHEMRKRRAAEQAHADLGALRKALQYRESEASMVTRGETPQAA